MKSKPISDVEFERNIRGHLMGLTIQRVTQIKSKLLFASLAIMAIAVQPMYGFVASQVANAETTDGPAEIAEFTATSKCVAGHVAVDVTALSKSTSAQASATYSTTIGEKLEGEWTDIPTGTTATGTLQSSEGEADAGIVTFMVPLGINTSNFYKYTAGYEAIDCGPVFVKTTPVDDKTIIQTNERFKVSAEATSSSSTIKSISWKMTGAKKIKSSDVFPKFKKVSDGKWAAIYETVNIPTGNYTLTFTATDTAGNETKEVIEGITLKPDTDGPTISSVKINNKEVSTADKCPTAEPFYVDETFDISAMLEDPSGVSKANFDLANVNSKNCSKGNLGVGHGMAVAENGKVQTTFDTTNINDGVYLLKIRGWDAKDNINSTQVLIKIDKINPGVTAHLDKSTNPTTVSGTVKDADSGADYAEYSIGAVTDTKFNYIADMNFPDNGKLAVDVDGNFTGTLDTNGLEDGEYTLRVRGFDKAGNKKSGVDITFTIETPTTTTDQGADNSGGDEGSGDENNSGNDSGIGKQDPINDDPIDDILNPLDAPRTPGANSIFNRNLALNLNGDDATDQATTDTLGDNTVNATPNSSVKGASDEKANTGLAWYWWAIIVAALLAAIWWIAAAARKKQDA